MAILEKLRLGHYPRQPYTRHASDCSGSHAQIVRVFYLAMSALAVVGNLKEERRTCRSGLARDAFALPAIAGKPAPTKAYSTEQQVMST